jgi:hypothetical protein
MESSPLGSLPEELRNRIFKYVFTYKNLECRAGRWHINLEEGQNRLSVKEVLHPTLVCKQIRKETKHLLTSLNTVVCCQLDRELNCWWVAPPLRDQCQWHLDIMKKMPPAFRTRKATIELDLCIQHHSQRLTPWEELSSILRGLVEALGPAKLIFHLDFRFSWDDAKFCIAPGLTPLGSFGKKSFEMCLADPTVAHREMVDLGKTFTDQWRRIYLHRNHHVATYYASPHVDTLWRRLLWAEEVRWRFMGVATLASMPEAS